MHKNLSRRLLRLEVAKIEYHLALEAVRKRFDILFAALAEDMQLSPRGLAQRFRWCPTPDGGNKIMRGEAAPSNEDIAKLLEIWLANQEKAK